ncbi:MAG: hypothetical protein LLF96_10205 [Eubacteriales bacterium]|nr:hypothetical protein [Eubacteriales bacterium]
MQAIVDAINNLSVKDGWDYAALLLPNILSFTAIILAIFIPIRISNRQDKIALFQLRYETYSSLTWIVRLKRVLSKENIDEAMEKSKTGKGKYIKDMILYSILSKPDKEMNGFTGYDILTKKFEGILLGTLLFKDGEKKEEICRKLYVSLLKLLMKPENGSFDTGEVIKLFELIEKDILPSMKKEIIIRR